MQAANADGVGSLQESSTFSTTAAELGVQSHCAEDEDVPQPEHEPADEASALNVLEVKEGEKDEESDEEKNKKKDEKDEDEELTASLVAGAFVASDAEQPEGEPPSYVESQADGEDPFEALGHVHLNRNPISEKLLQKLQVSHQCWEHLMWRLPGELIVLCMARLVSTVTRICKLMTAPRSNLWKRL